MASINNAPNSSKKALLHQQMRRNPAPIASNQDEVELLKTTKYYDTKSSYVFNRNLMFGNISDAFRPKTLGDETWKEPTNCVLSDVDQQLLFSISFCEPVTLTAIAIVATHPPTNLETTDEVSGPSVLKLYSNLPNLDFDEAEGAVPSQRIELTKEMLIGQKISLKSTKFHRCLVVHILVDENQQTTDYSFLNTLKLWGFLTPTYNSQYIT